jgi:pimeloyl-ACP methyl ester carboxylesterase
VNDDLGDRSPRWAGIRSGFVDVDGIRVHMLRADAAVAAQPDASTHLLLHGVGSTAASWLDVMGPLTRIGPVVAVDLPGAGRTVPPDRRAARPEAHARLLGPLVRALGLERAVVHGWSMGGLVAVLLAAHEPHRVERLVLANPGLPGPLSALGVLGWQTVGRSVLGAGAPLARWLLRLLVRRMAAKGTMPTSRPELIGGDLSRMSPEIATLLTEEREWVMSQPWRIDGYVTQWAATTSALYVRRRHVTEAIDRVAVPTLLLWGDDDPLIGRAVIDDVLARRPDWELHVFESVGHAPPLEMPEAYVDAVARWAGDVKVPGR